VAHLEKPLPLDYVSHSPGNAWSQLEISMVSVVPISNQRNRSLYHKKLASQLGTHVASPGLLDRLEGSRKGPGGVDDHEPSLHDGMEQEKH